MIRKALLLTLVVCLLMLFSSTGSVHAGGGLTALGTSVEVDFPAKLSFTLSAESNVAITDIRFHYVVNRMAFARVTSEAFIEFEPGTRVEIEWTWDMRKTGALPPGSSLEYWWTLVDAGGAEVATERTEIRIEDDRYDWHALTEDKITISWYKGDDSFAQDIMAAAQQALARLGEYTGAELINPVKIYVYANSDDLQGSMIYPKEWTGGAAFTRHGVIAIGIAPGSLEWGSRAIAHELTHLVIHQMTFNPYGGLPNWLDEGLAMNSEGELSGFYTAILLLAVEEDKLISVRSLASPFSAFAEESVLAYAQSYAIVRFLTDSYGSEKMFELLNTFKQGSGYDEALLEVYGFDMDELNSQWREYMITGRMQVESMAGAKLSPAQT